MKNTSLILFLLWWNALVFGQTIDQQIQQVDRSLDSLETSKNKLLERKQELKLTWIQQVISTCGFPANGKKEELISHSALVLSYNEEHEQANWVMHVITADVVSGNTSRTNDFRVDPDVKSGSAVEADYFVRTKKADSSGYDYIGYGYDRGHLAPSADFRWSPKALSESFYYSNMSPQLASFNREKWAELEDWLRTYVEKTNHYLVVVTAPVLNEELPKIKQSVNGVSIPKLYVKVAIDLQDKKGIAFVMPNQQIKLPLESFAVAIDSVEKLIGYDLFAALDDALEKQVESSFEIKLWLPESEKGDVQSLDENQLPKDAVNTYSVDLFVDDHKKHTICGTVVSTKKHDKGHVFINLDKKFPNQIFSVSIFESSIKNFSYQPEVYLINKQVCFTGMVSDYNGTPSMVIEHEKAVKLLSEF